MTAQEPRPEVRWSLRALRGLRAGLVAQPGAAGRDLNEQLDQLTDVLRETFFWATLVVVQDRLHGFRNDRDSQILMVELFGPRDSLQPPETPECQPGGRPLSGQFLVKLGGRRALQQELDAWLQCRPLGLGQDLVFLPVWRDPAQWERAADRPVSLVYGSAQQFLGVASVELLEDAIRWSVRAGVPAMSSVTFVLTQLFERLGQFLYSRCRVDDPDRLVAVEGRPGQQLDPAWQLTIRRLVNDPVESSLSRWRSPELSQQIQTDVDAVVNAGPGLFIDPADYFDYLAARVDAARQARAEQTGEDAPPQAYLHGLVPRTLRGCAHGDLHARNVLVGLVHERALWPVLFDYEDMATDNHLALDFAKLETELKIRLYDDLFRGSTVDFIRRVQQFELQLDELTEACHQDGSWPTPVESGSELDRLRDVLLTIRRMASLHLGQDQGRPKEWLEEYYFLQAGYALSTIRFPNLSRRKLLAAFVSAGVSAARLSHPRKQLEADYDALGADPNTSALPRPRAAAESILAQPACSSWARLAWVRRLVRSEDPDRTAEAIDYLTELCGDYPRRLELGHELVLAKLEQANLVPEQADALRQDAERWLQTMSGWALEHNEEMLCRIGRIYKQRGDTHLQHRRDAQARELYEQALRQYELAAAVRQGHYPAINVATLRFLVASLADGDGPLTARFDEPLVRALVQQRRAWPADSAVDREVWHLATEAEAQLLLGEWTAAANCYREALESKHCEAHAVESMKKQATRILEAFRRVDPSRTVEFDPEVVFQANGN